MSAVLPEPTGPPTPTRSGPCGWIIRQTPPPVARMDEREAPRNLGRVSPGFAPAARPLHPGYGTSSSTPEQARVLRLVPLAREIGAEGGGSHCVERNDGRALC